MTFTVRLMVGKSSVTLAASICATRAARKSLISLLVTAFILVSLLIIHLIQTL